MFLVCCVGKVVVNDVEFVPFSCFISLCLRNEYCIITHTHTHVCVCEVGERGIAWQQGRKEERKEEERKSTSISFLVEEVVVPADVRVEGRRLLILPCSSSFFSFLSFCDFNLDWPVEQQSFVTGGRKRKKRFLFFPLGEKWTSRFPYTDLLDYDWAGADDAEGREI